MSKRETVQLLKYLLDIPKLSLNHIPVENQYDVLLGLYSKNRSIKKLKISYIDVPFLRATSYLSITTCPGVNERIDIKIAYKHEEIPLLPRIGLIEQSGKYLQFIEIDMGFDFRELAFAILDSDHGVTFASILQQCPHLLGICICNTALQIFGSRLLFQDRIKTLNYITLNDSLIHSSFLPSLSSSISYISQFKLKNCQFKLKNRRFMEEAALSTREINMPDTKFHSIVYEDSQILSRKVYLKLAKTVNDTVSWYLIQDHHINICTESNYIDSLQDRDTVSFFIHCKDASTVRVRLDKLDIIFNP